MRPCAAASERRCCTGGMRSFWGAFCVIRLSIAVAAGVLMLATAAPSVASDRATSDRPDDLPAGTQQIHVMYVLPSDGVDRGLDIGGTLAASVDSLLDFLNTRPPRMSSTRPT